MLHGNHEPSPPEFGFELHAAAQVGGHDPVREGLGQGGQETRGKTAAPFGHGEEIASGTSATTLRQFEREEDDLVDVFHQLFRGARLVDLGRL